MSVIPQCVLLVVFHTKTFRRQKNHKVTDIKNDDCSVFKTEIGCPNHKDIYTVYCTKCRCLVCQSCLTSDHKGHAFSPVDEEVQEKRIEAKKLFDEGKTKLAKTSKVIADLKSIQIAQKENETKIITTAAALTDIVENVKQAYLQEVEKSRIYKTDGFESAFQGLETKKARYGKVCDTIKQLMSETHNIIFCLSFDRIKENFRQIDDVTGYKNLDLIKEFDVTLFTGDILSKMKTCFGRSMKDDDAKDAAAKELEKHKVQLFEEENKRKIAEKEINDLNIKLGKLKNKIQCLKGRRGLDEYNQEEKRIEDLEKALRDAQEEAFSERKQCHNITTELCNLQQTLKKEENTNERNKSLADSLQVKLDKTEKQCECLYLQLNEELESKGQVEDRCKYFKEALEDAVRRAENGERTERELRRRCEEADEKFQEEHRIRLRFEAEVKSLEDE